MASTDPLGSALNPLVNPKVGFSWVAPTANEPSPDGSPTPAFDAKAEIVSYLIGVRNINAGTQAGTYAAQTGVSDPTATTEALSLLGVLAPGNYAAAIQVVGPQNSPWSAEVFFDIVPVIPVPMPPSGFTVS